MKSNTSCLGAYRKWHYPYSQPRRCRHANGLAAMEGVLKTKVTLRGVVDIEIVAFTQSGLMSRPGTAELLDQAMAMGADLVGGLDPCGIDADPKGHSDAIFGRDLLP